MSTREEVHQLIFNRYSVEAEYPWSDFQDACVFRHADNRKWFAIAMRVKPLSIGKSGDDFVDIMNVKIVPDEIYDLLRLDGLLPAYHMNKKHWITVMLDGSVSLEMIAKLLDISFDLTRKKLRRRKDYAEN